jgi:hypothetical protein
MLKDQWLRSWRLEPGESLTWLFNHHVNVIVTNEVSIDAPNAYVASAIVNFSRTFFNYQFWVFATLLGFSRVTDTC